MIWKRTFLIILIWIGSLAWGKTRVLVCEKTTEAQDFSQVLKENPSFISIGDVLETENGAVSRELLQAVRTLKANSQGHARIDLTESQKLIAELTGGILSPARKTLLVELISQPSLRQTFPSHQLQLQTLNESPLDHRGTVTIPIELPRRDDRLYINGFRIDAKDVRKLKLYPQVFYHVAYISSAYAPQFQWELGSRIQALSKQSLVQGTCLSPSIEGLDKNDSFSILFPNRCLTALPGLPSMSINHSGWPLMESAPPFRSEVFFKDNNAWLFAGGLLLLGAGIHAVKKRYDIQVSFPF